MFKPMFSLIALFGISLSAVAADGSNVWVEETDTWRMNALGEIHPKLEAFRLHDPAQPSPEQMLAEIEAGQQFGASEQPFGAVASKQAIQGQSLEKGVPGIWKGFGGVPHGCNGRITAIVKGPDDKIFLGGDFSFTVCNDVVVNRIAGYDPETNRFFALGEDEPGLNSSVSDMTLDVNGDLIVAGSFNQAGGQSTPQLARWDGSQWSPIGNHTFLSSVFAVQVDPATGDIYVGGFIFDIFFSGEDPLPVNHIAVWDGTAWSALGDGVNDSVEAIEVIGSRVFAGGFFTEAGGQPAERIAAWDGNGWEALGSGVNGIVRQLATDGTDLFAGGGFSEAGGISTGPIARWDGTEWSSIDAPCCFGGMAAQNKKLYVTGGFLNAGGVNAPRVAVWDGDVWSAAPGNSVFAGFGERIISDGEEIFVAGNFVVHGTFDQAQFPDQGFFANGVARFSAQSQAWEAMGTGEGNGLNGQVNSMLATDQGVLVAGFFTAAGNQPVRGGIMQWDGAQWKSVGDNPPCGNIREMTLLDEILFANTSCLRSGEKYWRGTARWDGTSWEPVGQGLASSVLTVAGDESTGNVFFGGTFVSPDSDPDFTLNRVAGWDGIDYFSLGSGDEIGVSSSTSGFVNVQESAARNGEVMIGGSFDRAGTVEVDELALWDGSAWSVPGDGLNNGDFSPFITALAGDGDSFYAAGSFNRSGAQPLRRVGRFDGMGWLPLEGEVGEGTSIIPRSLLATSDFLYVGGDFLEAGGRPAGRIARWDGEDWMSLGTGAGNGITGTGFQFVQGIASSPAGIFLGGVFAGNAEALSANLIRFVPMEDLDLELNVEIIESEAAIANVGLLGMDESVVRYEITTTNNGDFALVDSVLDITWSPSPLAIEWTCQPVPPATRGCNQGSGSGSLNDVLEVPAGASVLFLVDVIPDLETSPFLGISGSYGAAPVAGATGTTSSRAVIQTGVSEDAIFKDDFDG